MKLDAEILLREVDALFVKASRKTGYARRTYIRRAYKVWAEALNIDHTIDYGATYPGMKALKAYYRKRIDKMCSETPEQKILRGELKRARRACESYSTRSRSPSIRSIWEEALRAAELKYAAAVGMTVMKGGSR